MHNGIKNRTEQETQETQETQLELEPVTGPEPRSG